MRDIFGKKKFEIPSGAKMLGWNFARNNNKHYIALKYEYIDKHGIEKTEIRVLCRYFRHSLAGNWVDGIISKYKKEEILPMIRLCFKNLKKIELH